MYRIGSKYKIELKKGIFYTGDIIEEDANLIRLFSVRGEDIIVAKSEILQSVRIEVNRIGEDDESRRQS